MSLSKFKTFLWSATKNANIGFYQKYENDTEDGSVLEATFSRLTFGGQATSGASVFRDGQLIELAEDEPDWDESSGSPVLKMRPQAENLLLRSEEFDNSAWVKSALTVVANNSISPNGSANADLLYPTTSGTNRQVLQSKTVANTTSYDLTFFAKTAGKSWLFVGNVPASSNAAWFDIENGVVGTTIAGVDATIEPLINGWFKCSLRSTSSSTSGFAIIAISDADNSNSVTASGTDGVLLSGAQLIPFDSGYIPTGATTVTRSSNSFEFTDLVTNGVFGVNSEFSFLFYAPDSIGIGSGNTQAGIQFSNNSTPVWSFWSNSGRSVLRPYSNVESGGYMDFSNIDYTTGEAILCTYDGQTITFYNSSGLLNIFSFDNPQPINELTLRGDVFSYSLESGRFALAPFELTEAEAIAAINEAQL